MSWKRPPRLMAKFLEQKRQKLVAEVGDSLVQAAEAVKAQTDLRTLIPPRISKQDAPGGNAQSLTRRSPVRIKIEKRALTARVRLATFYTRARTKGVIAIMARLGLAKELFRTSLIVRGRRFAFRTNPRLAIWAMRPEKGFQMQRHVVRLRSAQAREDLVLGPALAKSQPKVLEIWRRAAKRGLSGT